MKADIRIRNASQIALGRKEKYQTDLAPIHVLIISVCEVKCRGSCHHGSGHILPRYEFENINVLKIFSVWKYWNENNQTANKPSGTIYRRGITWSNEITKRISCCQNIEFQRKRCTKIISCYWRWSDSISSILSSLQSYDKEYGFIKISRLLDSTNRYPTR